MHLPHIHKFHIFSHTFHFLEHHIFAAILSVSTALCLVYLLNTPIVQHTFSTPGVSAHSSGMERALTLLDDPRYEHEFERRTAYITHHLDTLRQETQATRVYLVSYRDGSSRSGGLGLLGLELSHSFEVGQVESTDRIRDYQHLPRTNWLRMNRNGLLAGGILPGPCPRSYGIELYNERGGAIAYLGIDFLPEDSAYHAQEAQLLRNAVKPITDGLLGPFEQLK